MTAYCSQELFSEEEIENMATKRAGVLGIYRIAAIEDRKFWLIASISSLIIYIYCITSEFKDAFIMERQTQLSINVLKTFIIPPTMVIFSLLISKLLVQYSNKRLLEITFLLFSAYFVLYGLVLLNFREYLEPPPYFTHDFFCDQKMKFKGVQSIVSIFTVVVSWTSTFNFIATELWGTVVVTLLFMSFTNDICPFKQFMRFMPIFSAVSNVFRLLSALTIYFYHRLRLSLSYDNGNILLRSIFIFLGVLCLLSFVLQKFLDKVLLQDVISLEGSRNRLQTSVDFWEGVKIAFSSRLALSLSLISLFFNILTNMIDSTYRCCLEIGSRKVNEETSLFFLKKQALNQFITGSAVIVLLVTPLNRMVELFGWGATAFINAFIVGLSSALVFSLALYNTSRSEKNLDIFNNFYRTTISRFCSSDLTGLEANIGLFCTSLLKISKYAVYSIVKESISMRINSRYRSRFKGVYDGIFERLGKAGGSVISIFCVFIFNTEDVRESSSFYIFISLVFFGIWTFVVKYLALKYDESVKRNKNIDIDLIGSDKQRL